jgi:hypothetical protein
MRRFKHLAISLIVIVTFFAVGCASRAADQAKRKPIYQRAHELLKVPPKHEKKKWPKNTIISLEKGMPAPSPGILLSEPRAMDAAKLRISYNKLFDISSINSRFFKVVIDVADKQLQDADAEIRRLRRKERSWWGRNKLSIGLVGGFVFGVSITGLIVWGVAKATQK